MANMPSRSSFLPLAVLALLPALAAGSCAEGSPVEPSTSSASSSGDPCEGIDVMNDPRNCGACGRTCVVPHGSAACAGGECAIGTCDLDFADCDQKPENGCELQDTCEEGSACPTACGSMGAISCADICAPTCVIPAEICNAQDDDCDGACDNGPVAGCRVGVHRAYNGANGHLFTTDLAEAQAWGLEAQNYFYLYNDAAADLRPFFRCPKAGSQAVFYSDSNDCEMTAAPLLTVGFIAPQPMGSDPPTCGAIPLYRIHLAGPNWHFYTTSAAERDAAVANGWTNEGVAGFVWTAP